MPGETQVGPFRTDPGVEISDRFRPRFGESQGMALEPETFQKGSQHIDRPGILGRYTRPANQCLRQIQRLRRSAHGENPSIVNRQSRKRSLIDVLDRVFSSTRLTMTAQ